MKRERYDSQQVGEPSKTNRFRRNFSRAANIVATGGIILFNSDKIVTQETPDSKFKKTIRIISSGGMSLLNSKNRSFKDSNNPSTTRQK